jgi:ATP-dependent Lon protease
VILSLKFQNQELFEIVQSQSIASSGHPMHDSPVVQGQTDSMGEFVQHEPYSTNIQLIPETEEEGVEVEALARNARDQFAHIGELITSIPREFVASVQAIEDPLQTVYTIANFQRMDLTAAQSLLELDSVKEKLHKLVTILTREIEVLEIGQKIQNEARSEIEKARYLIY